MHPLQRVQSHLSINGFSSGTNRPRTVRRGSVEVVSQRSPSRNSHDLSRTGTPSFHVHRLSDEEVEEKDEFSYGFSNRRSAHEEDDYAVEGSGRKPDDFRRGSQQFVHTISGFESLNKYYD